jgi:hypothetical protein
VTTQTPPRPAAYQPTSDTDALLHAELTGADNVYSGDWHTALKDAAARWAAEGAMARLDAAGITNNPHEQEPTPNPPYPIPLPPDQG